MAQCYCYCHRTYDSCPRGGKCCQEVRENEEREIDFWEGKEGKKIMVDTWKEMIESEGYKVKLTKIRTKGDKSK